MAPTFANNGNITVSYATGSRTITISFGGTASAQAIVNAVNTDVDTLYLVTAAVANGNTTGRTTGTNPANGGANDGTIDGGADDVNFGVLLGNVTGLSFDTAEPRDTAGNPLFGVTTAGELINISRFGTSDLRADTTLIANFSNATVNSTVFFEQPSPDSISRAFGSWIDDGFQVGQTITVSN